MDSAHRGGNAIAAAAAAAAAAASSAIYMKMPNSRAEQGRREGS